MSDAKLAIIVPTRNRAHLLEALLSNIHETTDTAHETYLLVERSDTPTVKALEHVNASHRTICGRFGCYVASANRGVKRTSEPYLIVANDDVRFHPGWDTAALEQMKDPIRVVGVDQGNGRTDCFFLVDRRYIAEHGFYHEGYRSQFCDTEFADRAKARGVWADAPGALIEHIHWTLGKSGMDENYAMAVASVPADQQLYMERRAQWAPG